MLSISEMPPSLRKNGVDYRNMPPHLRKNDNGQFNRTHLVKIQDPSLKWDSGAVAIIASGVGLAAIGGLSAVFALWTGSAGLCTFAAIDTVVGLATATYGTARLYKAEKKEDTKATGTKEVNNEASKPPIRKDWLAQVKKDEQKRKESLLGNYFDKIGLSPKKFETLQNKCLSMRVKKENGNSEYCLIARTGKGKLYCTRPITEDRMKQLKEALIHYRGFALAKKETVDNV